MGIDWNSVCVYGVSFNYVDVYTLKYETELEACHMEEVWCKLKLARDIDPRLELFVCAPYVKAPEEHLYYMMGVKVRAGGEAFPLSRTIRLKSDIMDFCINYALPLYDPTFMIRKNY